MLPYATLILLKKTNTIPLYLQICNGIIQQIKNGTIQKGSKLPGSRYLSQLLSVNRNTVIAAYEELESQGWIKIKSSSGAYVSLLLPEIKPEKFLPQTFRNEIAHETGFLISKNTIIDANVFTKTNLLEINDGLPDDRLAPMDSLSRAMANVLKGQRGKVNLSYSPIAGNLLLRTELAHHLNETRGFSINTENIFITRGTIMALYLSLHVLLNKGDQVIVGEMSYRSTNMIVQQLGGRLLKVPVDKHGICTDSIDRICRKTTVRAIYLTPHHHYPTTVTMPPERRIALLEIAKKHGIAILEDDYDYDYHYRHSPFLPLASSDPNGLVIYIGSFSKTFSPAFRVGYLSAPLNFINEIAKLRRIIDRQGDNIMEHAIAELIRSGEIKNHLRKSQNAYHQRRDLFCKLLREKLNHAISFEIPEGGMAVWGKFATSISLPNLAKIAQSNGLYISDGLAFDPPEKKLNATRLGFASLNFQEIEMALELLKKSVDEIT